MHTKSAHNGVNFAILLEGVYVYTQVNNKEEQQHGMAK